MLSALVICAVSCSKKIDYNSAEVDEVIKSATSSAPSQATYANVIKQQEVVMNFVNAILDEVEECESASDVEKLQKKYESSLKTAEKQMQEMNGILSSADLDKTNKSSMQRLEEIQRQLVLRMWIIGEKTQALN